MKKIVAVTIALCLVFAAVVPCFAASDVVVTAFFNAASNTGINAGQLMQSLLNTIVAINSKLPAVTSTGTVFENIDTRLGHIESWLVPSNSAGTNPSLYQLILELGIAAQSYLPYIPTISNYVGNWMASNNNYLDLVSKGVGFTNYTGDYSLWMDIYKTSHRQLLYANPDHTTGTKMDGTYYLPYIYSDGRFNLSGTSQNWRMGTPLGNIALILKRNMELDAMAFNYRWAADLKHYNDTLTTWDSQGDTLTQVTFSPESAIQGLYRYLAFTQRDVARLSYVFSNDAELQAREYAQGNQNTVTDLFINPDSDSSAKQTDFASVSDQSELARNNLSTGYSAYGIWGGFDPGVYSGTDGWFTQTTANNLDTSTSVASTRSTKSIQPVIKEDYPTPLLDAYYQEIYSLQGDLDD